MFASDHFFDEITLHNYRCQEFDKLITQHFFKGTKVCLYLEIYCQLVLEPFFFFFFAKLDFSDRRVT